MTSIRKVDTTPMMKEGTLCLEKTNDLISKKNTLYDEEFYAFFIKVFTL